MNEHLLDLRIDFDPIVGAFDEQPVAHEVLLRPVGGGDLETQANRAAVDMGWVTNFALQTAGAVLERSPLALHVNVAPADLRRPEFVEAVRSRIPGTSLVSLVLEVGGHQALQDDQVVRSTLVDLRRLGVRIALDDFGEGWADAARVELLQPEMIKVRLARLRSADAFITAIALRQFADEHAAPVVVEDVARPADLELVRNLGFAHAQGRRWRSLPDIGGLGHH